MKLVKLRFVVGAGIVTLALQMPAAWASRPIGSAVSGEVTATPTSGRIQVAHHVYRIKVNSPADKNFRSFNQGQLVDLILDGPPDSQSSSVLVIAAHTQ